MQEFWEVKNMYCGNGEKKQTWFYLKRNEEIKQTALIINVIKNGDLSINLRAGAMFLFDLV